MFIKHKLTNHTTTMKVSGRQFETTARISLKETFDDNEITVKDSAPSFGVKSSQGPKVVRPCRPSRDLETSLINLKGVQDASAGNPVKKVTAMPEQEKNPVASRLKSIDDQIYEGKRWSLRGQASWVVIRAFLVRNRKWLQWVGIGVGVVILLLVLWPTHHP